MKFGLVIKMNNGDIFFISPRFYTNDEVVQYFEDKQLTDIIKVKDRSKRTVFIMRNNVSSYMIVNKEEYDEIINEF